jgi:hypothetical protein
VLTEKQQLSCTYSPVSIFHPHAMRSRAKFLDANLYCLALNFLRNLAPAYWIADK